MITDTLTDYVKLNAGTSITVTMKDSAGNEVDSVEVGKLNEEDLKQGKEFSDKALVKADETTIPVTVAYEPTSVPTNGKITLKFPEDYELEKGMTYEITMNISPTQKAVDEYASDGYPHTGDSGTDAPDVAEANYTSSGKKGFYSNSSAAVEYTYNDAPAEKPYYIDEYDKPVVQVSTTKSIEIVKKWADADNAYNTRDGVELEFKVQQCVPQEGVVEANWEWTDYKTETMTVAKADSDPSIWKLTVSDLPLKNEHGESFAYRTVEVNCPDGYTVSYAGDSNANVTNTLNWKIIKQSTSVENGEHVKVSGAIFSVTAESGNVVYYGKSGDTGEVVFYKADQYDSTKKDLIENPQSTTLDDGKYTLQEIKARPGYALDDTKWALEIIDGVASIKVNGAEKGAYDAEEKCVIIAIDNTPLYELPSAGGPGIYWHLIGGILLMIAAVVILYKNKRRETY